MEQEKVEAYRDEYEKAFETWLSNDMGDIELIDALGIRPTIGQLSGIVNHTFSITNNHDDKVQVAVKIDFRTATDADIKVWLTSNRIIAGQRPWRSLTKVELEKMDGSTFIAQAIGQKVKSYEVTKAEAINAFDLMTPEQKRAHIEELEQLAKSN